MSERWQDDIKVGYGPIIKENHEEKGFDINVQLKALCRLTEVAGSVPRAVAASPQAHQALGDSSILLDHNLPPGSVIVAKRGQ